MKLQFDANQSFQIDAVNAVADLFDGQRKSTADFSIVSIIDGDGLFAGAGKYGLG